MEEKNILDQVKLDRQRRGEEEDLTKAEEKEYAEIAERRVRLGLILAELGNEQGITVADAELQKAVITEAQKFPGQEREVFDYYGKNPQALESLRAPLFEEKVVDYILELADVKEKSVSQDELMKALDDEVEAKPKKKAASKKSSAKKDDAEKKPAAKKKAPAKSAAKSKAKKKDS